MSLDVTPLGELAAEVMERIEREYGDEATVGICAVVVEVDVPSDDPEDPGFTEILYRCTDQRRWVQAGLFDAAKRAVFYSATHPDGDGE